MAHITEVIGVSSQLAAKLALLSNGWIVAEPETAEPFDLVARDPVNGRWYTFQVKTIRIREDRGGEYVVNARRGGDRVYEQSDADYIIGVLGAGNSENRVPEVYMFENRGISEYWASKERAERRWIRLPIEIDRAYYEGDGITCPA